MDDAVLRSMARWPDLPAVFGWLMLDARGNWLLRRPAPAWEQQGAQAVRFERVGNVHMREFISRNYAADDRGRWFFQNGPQRVYARLERTPLVYRSDGTWMDHCGRAAGRLDSAWLDETGAAILAAERGVGVVDDRDLERLSRDLVDRDGCPDPAILEAILEAQAGPGDDPIAFLRCARGSTGAMAIPVRRIHSRDLPAQFGFETDPQPGP